MSPVYSATATAGHLSRVAVMPTPADTSISLLRPQPETVTRTAVPHSRTSDLRVEGRRRVMMIWLSIPARRQQGIPPHARRFLSGVGTGRKGKLYRKPHQPLDPDPPAT